MRYDILVKGFRLKSARMVVAHLLAREENVPLHQALAMLNDLPRPLFRNLGSDEAKARLEQYRKAGVDMDTVEAALMPLPEPVQEKGVPPPAPHHPPAAPVPAVHHGPTLTAPISPPAGHGGGIPLKDLLLVKDEPPRGPRDRRLLWSWLLLAALVAALAAPLVLISRAQRHFSGQAVTVAAESSAGGTAGADAPATAAAGGTVTVTAEGRARALAYDDSARACGSDAEAAIRFFRLAIAFNRYNVHAWYGLLDACRRAGRTEEAGQARVEMEKLFGTDVFTAEKILGRFGTPLEYQLGSDGSLHIEYRTKTANNREKLVAEAYLVARELKNSGANGSLSLFASTTASCGLMVHCGSGVSFASVEQFEAGAKIYFFDRQKKKRE